MTDHRIEQISFLHRNARPKSFKSKSGSTNGVVYFRRGGTVVLIYSFIQRGASTPFTMFLTLIKYWNVQFWRDKSFVRW